MVQTMDWKTFVSNIVGDVTWPIVVVVGGFAFRKQIMKLIPDLESVKGPGFQLKFARNARELASKAEAVVSSGEGHFEVEGKAFATVTPPAETEIIPTSLDHLRLMVTVSPRAAVTESWIQIEEQIGRLAAPYGRPTGPGFMLRKLTEAAVIPEDLAEIIRGLMVMRNQIVHNAKVDPGADGALAYLDAVETVRNALEGLNRE